MNELGATTTVLRAATETPPGPTRARRVTSTVLLLCLSVSVPAGETVYKRVGEQGAIEFSDTQTPDSEAVVIEEPQTVESFAPGRLPELRPRGGQQGSTEYTLRIEQPDNDQVLTDNTGTVSVSVSVGGKLTPGHQLQVTMDGKVVGEQPSFTLSNIDRGSHVLLAKIVDAKGGEVATSAPVTFHVQRHFIRPKPAAN